MQIERIECLDHGYVELVDVMGDDQAVIDAARVSISGLGVKPTSSDIGLIRYLLRHKHTTPLEMVEWKFRCKMPIFIARQWIRHRTANVNEKSARYSELPEEFYVPELEAVCYQSGSNKQGREGPMPQDRAQDFANECEEAGSAAFAAYRTNLNDDMARELARINLPLSTYTEWIWKIDLHNLMHFLQLRLHSHAQEEIRVFAKAMAKMVKARVPICWNAFEDFRLNAVTLSAVEIEHLRARIALLANPNRPVPPTPPEWPTQREKKEWEQKAAKFGIHY